MDDRVGARRAFEDPVRRHRGTGHHHACKAVTPVCRAARARKIPIVIDFDLKTTTDDPPLKLGSHVIASAEALRAIGGLSETPNKTFYQRRRCKRAIQEAKVEKALRGNAG